MTTTTTHNNNNNNNNMRKLVLMKNALHDRSVFQSPIGPMPRSNLTPPCPIALLESHGGRVRSQTPPPPSHSRVSNTVQLQTVDRSTITPPSVLRRLACNSPASPQRTSIPPEVRRVMHQPVRFNSPPPAGTTTMTTTLHHPQPQRPVLYCGAVDTLQTPSSNPTPPIRSKCPCCC